MAKKMMKFAKPERLAILKELDGEPETPTNIKAAQKRIADRKVKKSGMALVKGKATKKAAKKPAPAKYLKQRRVIELLNSCYEKCTGKTAAAKAESYNVELSFMLAAILSYGKFSRFTERLEQSVRSDK